jgi:hypothetical protein
LAVDEMYHDLRNDYFEAIIGSGVERQCLPGENHDDCCNSRDDDGGSHFVMLLKSLGMSVMGNLNGRLSDWQNDQNFKEIAE